MQKFNFTNKEWRSIIGMTESLKNYFYKQKWFCQENLKTNQCIYLYFQKDFQFFSIRVTPRGVERGNEYLILSNNDKQFLNNIIKTQNIALLPQFKKEDYESGKYNKDLFMAKKEIKIYAVSKGKTNIELQKVESSNLYAVGYDDKNKELIIQFGQPTPKSEYVYKNITKQMYNNLMKAESKGKFFHEKIRKNPNKYPYKGVIIK